MVSNLRQLGDFCLPWSTILVFYGIMRIGFRDDQRDISPTLTEEVTTLSASDCCNGEARKEELELEPVSWCI